MDPVFFFQIPLLLSSFCSKDAAEPSGSGSGRGAAPGQDEGSEQLWEHRGALGVGWGGMDAAGSCWRCETLLLCCVFWFTEIPWLGVFVAAELRGGGVESN